MRRDFVGTISDEIVARFSQLRLLRRVGFNRNHELLFIRGLHLCLYFAGKSCFHTFECAFITLLNDYIVIEFEPKLLDPMVDNPVNIPKNFSCCLVLDNTDIPLPFDEMGMPSGNNDECGFVALRRSSANVTGCRYLRFLCVKRRRLILRRCRAASLRLRRAAACFVII